VATRSDHIPVITVISAAPEVHIEAPRPNFRAADWEEVREEMALKLEDLEVDENIRTKAEFDTRLNQLMQVITEVIDTKSEDEAIAVSETVVVKRPHSETH